MSEYSYLTEDVKKKIKKAVKRNLELISASTPPLSVVDLYQNDKLSKQLFSKNNPEYISLVKDIGECHADRLRGILWPQDRRVVIIDAKYEKRNNFASLHEHGHWSLSWHRQMLYKCTQFDLSAKAKNQLEREANFYASELGFMGELFLDHLRSSDLSINYIQSLSDIFNMSVEATFRRSVELDIRPSAFVAMKVNKSSDEHFLTVDYAVHSTPFKTNIGEISPRSTLNKQHPIARIITDPLCSLQNSCECRILFGKNKTELKAEVWKNQWNVFALCQPV